MKGSILKRGKQCYLIRIFLGRDPVTGKEHRPCRTIHGTRKEAEAALRDWVSDYEQGKVVTNRKATFNQFLEEWKEILKADVEEVTFKRYTYDLDRFVKDTIGRIPLAMIRYNDLQDLYVSLVAKGTGPTSVQTLHGHPEQGFQSGGQVEKNTLQPRSGVQGPRTKAEGKAPATEADEPGGGKPVPRCFRGD